MKAFIYTGGTVHPDFITEHPKGDDLVIAADSGYSNAKLLGEKPSVIIGDFDSYGAGALPDGPEIIRLNTEKDNTDTQAAVDVALERGAEEIVIIGGLSGRLDHTLSNISVLEHLNVLRVYAVMTDGQSRVRFIRNGSSLIGRSGFKYLSVIAADSRVKGVEIDGVKYPLNKASLFRTVQYAVSNEITGNCALIAVKKGGIYVIESRDLNPSEKRH
ncbi:MAG: thiamine diphosphokinase [Clostridia bacterium]|nr:thiamine diphosphokinase [Clostridia bacterium]